MSKADTIVLDTGPLVALLDASDEHHAWAAAEFSRFEGKVRVCEAVLTEALFLLRALRPAQEKILEWVEREEAEGVGEAPYPPNFPKMPDEPKRVQPSRAKKA